MKKNYILCACAAAAFMFTSCQKEAPVSGGSSTDEPKQEETTPEIPEGEMGYITAVTLNTKTISPDGVNVYWENADEIALFVGAGDRYQSALYKATLNEPTASATFIRTGDVTPGNNEGEYYALYPSTSLNKWASTMANASSRRVYVDLPQSQTAVCGGWDKEAAILASSSKTSTFQFQHIVSYVKFTVDENSTPFNKMTISSRSGAIMSGENIGVIYKENEIVYDPTYTSGTYYTSASLSTSDASTFAPGTYYVAILPGKHLSGFKLTFDNGGETDAVVNTPENVELAAGEVADLGTIGTLVFPDPTPAFEPSLYVENGVNKGVVFWVNPTDPTKGLALSGATAKKYWHTTIQYFDDAAQFDTDDSQANFDYVTNLADYQANKANYEAAYFCESLGEGWRLPSLSEIETAFRVWSGFEGDLPAAIETEVAKDAAKTEKFDNLLLQCEGNEVAFATAGTAASWYWLGQANSADKKIRRVKVGPSTYFSTAARANGTNWVRCVRDVEIK